MTWVPCGRGPRVPGGLSEAVPDGADLARRGIRSRTLLLHVLPYDPVIVTAVLAAIRSNLP